MLISFITQDILFNVNKCQCYLLNRFQTNLCSSSIDRESYTLIDLSNHDNHYSLYHVPTSISHYTYFELIDPYDLSYQYVDTC